MQASKISIGDIYAIKRGGVLQRFRVTGITTHRNNNGTSNEVTGFVIDDNNTSLTLGVAEIIGPYQEQFELAEKARKEKEERETIATAKENARKKLVAILYKKTGAPVQKDYGAPFRTAYDGADISDAGVQLLLDYFAKN